MTPSTAPPSQSSRRRKGQAGAGKIQPQPLLDTPVPRGRNDASEMMLGSQVQILGCALAYDLENIKRDEPEVY